MSIKIERHERNLLPPVHGGYVAYVYHTTLTDKEREKLTFIAHDAFDFIEPGEVVIEICQFHVDISDRGQGHGKELFADLKKTVIDKYKNALIVIKAAPLIKDYPVEPEECEKTAEINRQCAWLEKHGFVDINDYCRFEHGIAYAYHNEIADRILDWIKQHGNDYLLEEGD